MQFFAYFKSRPQELSNDVSFVIFGHQTWDLEGGGSNGPPPTDPWFSSTPAGIRLIKLLNRYDLKMYSWSCHASKKDLINSVQLWPQYYHLWVTLYNEYYLQSCFKMLNVFPWNNFSCSKVVRWSVSDSFKR